MKQKLMLTDCFLVKRQVPSICFKTMFNLNAKIYHRSVTMCCCSFTGASTLVKSMILNDSLLNIYE
jgi:hypothetical protein